MSDRCCTVTVLDYDNARRMTDQNYHIIETLVRVAQRLGSTPARVALA
jgi:aryl-alcohol dehydrogenase-like predicted oxidoreductase